MIKTLTVALALICAFIVVLIVSNDEAINRMASAYACGYADGYHRGLGGGENYHGENDSCKTAFDRAHMLGFNGAPAP